MEIQPLFAEIFTAIAAIAAVLAVGATAAGVALSNARAKESVKREKRALAANEKRLNADQTFFQEAALSSQRDAQLLNLQRVARSDDGIDWMPWAIVGAVVLLLWLMKGKD